MRHAPHQYMTRNSKGELVTAFGVKTASGEFMSLEEFPHEPKLLDLVDVIRDWATLDQVPIMNKVQMYRLAKKILDELNVNN